jgi:hypothetical protein
MGGFVLALTIIWLPIVVFMVIYDNWLDSRKQKPTDRSPQKESLLAGLVGKFLNEHGVAHDLADHSNQLSDRFAVWLTTKNGSEALREANYPFATAVGDFEWFVKRYNLESKNVLEFSKLPDSRSIRQSRIARGFFVVVISAVSMQMSPETEPVLRLAIFLSMLFTTGDIRTVLNKKSRTG